MAKSNDKVKDAQAKINKRIKEVSDKINKQIQETGDKVTNRINKAKESSEKANDLARNIWLAGLGAYGKSYDEAISAYEKISKEAPPVFQDLVKKGEKLESEAKAKLDEGKESLASARADLEGRFSKARDSIDLESLKVAGKDYIANLEAKVEELTTKIEGLVHTDKKAGSAAKKSAKKKPAAKKAPAAKKPATKKPATKKPVAKKPVAKKPIAKKAAVKKPAAAKAPVAKKPAARKAPATRKAAPSAKAAAKTA